MCFRRAFSIKVEIIFFAPRGFERGVKNVVVKEGTCGGRKFPAVIGLDCERVLKL